LETAVDCYPCKETPPAGKTPELLGGSLDVQKRGANALTCRYGQQTPRKKFLSTKLRGGPPFRFFLKGGTRGTPWLPGGKHLLPCIKTGKERKGGLGGSDGQHISDANQWGKGLSGGKENKSEPTDREKCQLKTGPRIRVCPRGPRRKTRT